MVLPLGTGGEAAIDDLGRLRENGVTSGRGIDTSPSIAKAAYSAPSTAMSCSDIPELEGGLATLDSPVAESLPDLDLREVPYGVS